MKTLQRGVETKVVDLRRNFFATFFFFFFLVPALDQLLLRSAVVCRRYQHFRARAQPLTSLACWREIT